MISVIEIDERNRDYWDREEAIKKTCYFSEN